MLRPAHSKEAAAANLITGFNNCLVVSVALLHLVCINICYNRISLCKEAVLSTVKLHTKHIHYTAYRKVNLTVETSLLFCRNQFKKSLGTCNQIVCSSKHSVAFAEVFCSESIRLNTFCAAHICKLSCLNKNVCNLGLLLIIKIIKLISTPALCIFISCKIRITVSLIVVSKIQEI